MDEHTESQSQGSQGEHTTLTRTAPSDVVGLPDRNRVRAFLYGNWTSREVSAVYLWGVTGLVIAWFELEGAWPWFAGLFGNPDVPWNTISYTVGHMEIAWHPSSLVVVAVIVAAIYYGVALAPRRAPVTQDESYTAFAGAIHAALLGGSILVVLLGVTRHASKLDLSYWLYATIAIIGIIAPALRGLSHPHEPTLFTAVHALWERAHIVRYVLCAGLAVLAIHLALYPWPDYAHQSTTINKVSADGAVKLARDKIGKNSPLKFSTETRGDIPGASHTEEAWLVFFDKPGTYNSGCVVRVQSSTNIVELDASRCAPTP